MLQIAIAGSSEERLKEEHVAKVRAFASKLLRWKDEVILVTGGRGGVMAEASRVYSAGGGLVVGILPWEDEGNPYNTVRVKTGMNYPARSVIMLNMSHSLAVLGGGIGTMVESLLAYDLGIPQVILIGTGMSSDSLVNLLEEGSYDYRGLAPVVVTEDPEEAATIARELAEETSRSSRNRR